MKRVIRFLAECIFIDWLQIHQRKEDDPAEISSVPQDSFYTKNSNKFHYQELASLFTIVFKANY